jgi:hypothetical protein
MPMRKKEDFVSQLNKAVVENLDASCLVRYGTLKYTQT